MQKGYTAVNLEIHMKAERYYVCKLPLLLLYKKKKVVGKKMNRIKTTREKLQPLLSLLIIFKSNLRVPIKKPIQNIFVKS